MDVIVTDNGTIEIIEVEANTTTIIEQLSTGPQGPAGYALLSTEVDCIIQTNKSFIGIDEFEVNGTSTLTIEGTGRMMLIG